jgi:hypothetical protein
MALLGDSSQTLALTTLYRAPESQHAYDNTMDVSIIGYLANRKPTSFSVTDYVP